MDHEEKVPINLKLALTIREASEYSNIGINKIDSMLKQPECPFVLFVGTKKLVKRKEFEQFISNKLMMQPKTLQKLLGHASIKTTMDRYVHVTDESLVAGVKQFERYRQTTTP